MHNKHVLGVPLAVAMLTLATSASAEAPEPLTNDDDWDHFEVSMGFMGGQRNYSRTNFEHDEGADHIPGVAALSEPFLAPPYNKVGVAGLRWDARLVASHVRMTIGVDVPFTTFQARESVGVYDVGGEQRVVGVRTLQPVDLRFGIGAEYPLGPVAPFVDVMGSVHWVSTDVTIDGHEAHYDATSFALSGRAGARVHLREWFFAPAAGEVGFVGDVTWGAELAVGFALM